jgi:hypothetical protein
LPLRLGSGQLLPRLKTISQLGLEFADVRDCLVEHRVRAGQLLPELDDLRGRRRVSDEAYPDVTHRLLGPAELEQSCEQLLLAPGGISPRAPRLTPPGLLEERDQEVALANQFVDRLLRPTGSTPDTLPTNDLVADVGLPSAPSVVLLDAGANSLTFVAKVARRRQEDAER